MSCMAFHIHRIACKATNLYISFYSKINIQVWQNTAYFAYFTERSPKRHNSVLIKADLPEFHEEDLDDNLIDSAVTTTVKPEYLEAHYYHLYGGECPQYLSMGKDKASQGFHITKKVGRNHVLCCAVKLFSVLVWNVDHVPEVSNDKTINLKYKLWFPHATEMCDHCFLARFGLKLLCNLDL